MRLRGIIISLALFLAPAMWTGARAQIAPLAVVELFTSQACSSCPLVDAMISDLSQREDFIVLTLPVDYWDYTGWKDTLSLKEHAVRQRSYAALRGKNFLVTPQIVVNGIHALKEHERDGACVERVAKKLSQHSGTLAIPVTLTRVQDVLEVTVPTSHFHGRAEIWVSPVSRNRSVAVEKGENSGRTLKFSHVVRGWTKLANWNGEASTYHIPLSSLRHDGADRIVVLLQAGSMKEPGPILGAAALNIPEQPPNLMEADAGDVTSGTH